MLESKRRAIIFFLIAIILAVISGFLVLKKVQTLNAELGTMVQIYVAATDISSRAIITKNDVVTEEIPKKYLKNDHVTNYKYLMNKVSVVPLSSGDIITKSMLKEATAVIEEDNRLVTLMKSSRLFFDDNLSALDRVDLFVSHDLDGELITELFMKDVKVASVSKSSDSGLAGIKIEVPIEVVSDVIHMHNYADSIRVIKSNVGTNSEVADPQKESDTNETPEEMGDLPEQEQTESVENEG